MIRCYLQGRAERRQARVRERMARFQTPRDKILSVYDGLAEIVAHPDYRGCVFQRAGAEAGAGSSVKRTCDDSRAWLRGQFTELARAAGAPDPDSLGRQLGLLYDGAAMSAYLDQDLGAPRAARDVAEQLLPPAG